MAIRYAPMATVKTLSLVGLVEKAVQASGQNPRDVFPNEVTKLNAFISQNYDLLFNTLRSELNKGSLDTGSLFTTIGTASGITISEGYGTRPVYGIGEPANPELVPNNLAVRVSISKLTVDKASVARYVMKPIYWYNEVLQRLALDSILGTTGDTVGSSYFFYTYLAIGDLERPANSLLSEDAFDQLDDNYIIAMMPSDYSKRITNTTTIIDNNVNAEGKFIRVTEILRALVDTLGG